MASPPNDRFLTTIDLGFDTETTMMAAATPVARRRHHILVHLPFNQHSRIQARPEATLRNATACLLSKRGIRPEMCFVGTTADPNGPRISLDVSLESLDAVSELWIHSPYLQVMNSIDHSFESTTFFSASQCDVCRRPIMMQKAYRCTRCLFKFHARCWSKVPVHCDLIQQIQRDGTMAARVYETCIAMGGERAELASRMLSILSPSRPTSLLLPSSESSTSISTTVTSTSTVSTPSTSTSPPHPLLVPTRHSTSADAAAGIRSAVIAIGTNTTVGAAGSQLRKKSAQPTDFGPWPSADWQIDATHVHVGRKIGSGSFGTVYEATYFGPVAIKKLNVGVPTHAQLKAFKNEVVVLRRTRHPNVLLFLGWMHEPQLAIVTQWCKGSSLYRHIHVVEPRRDFTPASILEIGMQVAQGMNYLHARHIIHRDLKSNNIFLTDDATVKIGDFGLATVKTRWSGATLNRQPTGSILWMAPEVIRMKELNPYTTLSDVYAYGICLFELMSGKLPYANISNRDQIFFMVGCGALRPDRTQIRRDMPRALLALYERCILHEREERPEFSEVLRTLESIVLPRLERSASDPGPCNRHKMKSAYK